VELVKGQVGTTLVKLTADAQRRCCLEVSQDAGTKTYLFQPIAVEGTGPTLLEVRFWSSNVASLSFDGRDVLLDENANGERFIIKTKNPPVIGRELIFGDIDVSAAKSRAELLFLETVADIDRKMQEGRYYQTIRSAGMLWELLMDGDSTLNAVQRVYRHKLRFEIFNYRGELPIDTEVRWINLDASSVTPHAKTMTTDLDGFLNAPILITRGGTARVKDLISVCANAKGGRHFGKPKGRVEQQYVIDWDDVIKMFGKEPSELAISGICRIALRGLRSLVDAITSSKTSEL
jgi:hypothetical protein